MISFNFKWATLAVFSLCIIAPIVQAEITFDPKQKIPKKLGKGEGAITVVGDVMNIAISAVKVAGANGSTTSSAVCHGQIDEDAQTFAGPCFFEFKDDETTKVFHAECLKGKGSAAITFYKEAQNGNFVDVQTADQIWAGFDKKKPLQKGMLHSTTDGTKVILNCDNNKSLN